MDPIEFNDDYEDRSAAKPRRSKARCRQCGEPTGGMKFCPSCGARNSLGGLQCPTCGEPIAAGAKFCSECGTSLRPK